MRHHNYCLAGWLLGGSVLLNMLAGCQAFRPAARQSQFTYEQRCDQIVLHSESPLTGHERLVEQLCSQRQQLSSKLGLPTTERPIHIYLFADDNAYYDFIALRFPGFSSRRAIFVDTEVELAVYAYWGDHLAEDLRHEVTHGYLHSALPRLPLWLDEGLAEYFEVGHSKQGLNQLHLDYLNNATDFQPNLSRLEQLASATEMTQRDYAESWAWVHFLLESDVDKTHLLVDYLDDLEQGATTALSTKLHKRLAGPEVALVEHLRTLR